MSEPFDTIAIVGVGLIGGSIGLAALRRGVARRVIGIGRTPRGLGVALERGAITEACVDWQGRIAESQLVLVCTPASTVVEQVRQAARTCPDAMVTDCASTKASIVYGLEEDVCQGLAFLGGHPLAGNHQGGPEAATAELFEGRKVLLTPTAATPAEVQVRVAQFWSRLGGETVMLSAAEHDRLLAITSHLPHLVATMLALTTADDQLPYVASGWQDTTRVAAGQVEIWRDILRENRAQILHALHRYRGVFDEFEAAIADGDFDRLAQLLQEGKQRRDRLGN